MCLIFSIVLLCVFGIVEDSRHVYGFPVLHDEVGEGSVEGEGLVRSEQGVERHRDRGGRRRLHPVLVHLKRGLYRSGKQTF